MVTEPSSNASVSNAHSQASPTPQLTLQDIYEQQSHTSEEISQLTWSAPLLSAHTNHQAAPALFASIHANGPQECQPVTDQEDKISDDNSESDNSLADSDYIYSESDSGSETSSDSSVSLLKPDTSSPSLDDIRLALQGITTLLKPPRKNGRGYLPFLGGSQLQHRLEMMRALYVNSSSGVDWMQASAATVKSFGYKVYHACALR